MSGQRRERANARVGGRRHVLAAAVPASSRARTLNVLVLLGLHAAGRQPAQALVGARQQRALVPHLLLLLLLALIAARHRAASRGSARQTAPDGPSAFPVDSKCVSHSIYIT